MNGKLVAGIVAGVLGVAGAAIGAKKAYDKKKGNQNQTNNQQEKPTAFLKKAE